MRISAWSSDVCSSDLALFSPIESFDPANCYRPEALAEVDAILMTVIAECAPCDAEEGP